MNKKIIILTLIVLLGIGGYWFYTNQTEKNNPRFYWTENQKNDNVQEKIETDPEEVIKEAETLDQDEEELDSMIDDLENMKF